MKTAIILHGMPSREEYFNPRGSAPSNQHWIPWIQYQLIQKNILAQAVELPEPYEPDYEKWRAVFEQFKVDENTMLIGHSCGAGFLVRWLSENKIKVGKVALVAPFINPDEPRVKPGFFDFTIDPHLAERTAGVRIFISNDDDLVIVNTAERLKQEIKGVQVEEFEDRGHFTLADMMTKEFPALRDWLLE